MWGERIPLGCEWIKGEQGSHLSEAVAVVATPVPACCQEELALSRPNGPIRLIWSVSLKGIWPQWRNGGLHVMQVSDEFLQLCWIFRAWAQVEI